MLPQRVQGGLPPVLDGGEPSSVIPEVFFCKQRMQGFGDEAAAKGELHKFTLQSNQQLAVNSANDLRTQGVAPNYNLFQGPVDVLQLGLGCTCIVMDFGEGLKTGDIRKG